MTTLRDIASLIARLLLGSILIAHGWQKLNEWGISGTTDAFRNMGVPNPEIAATVSTYFELIAGAMLVLGLLVRFVGPLIFVQMVGAFWFAHRGNGVFIDNGGWELVAVIGAAGLAIAAAGAGRISLDQVVAGPMRKRRERKRLEEATEKGMAVQHSDGSVTYPAEQAPVNTIATTSQAAPAAAPAQPQPQHEVSETGGHQIVAEQAPTNQFPSENR